MPYILREMKESDIPAVQKVAKTTWNATYEGLIPQETQEKFIRLAYSDDRMLLRLERSLLLVAEADEEVVGFVNLSFPNDEGKVKLGAIYIYPEFQGAGIGSALLEKGITQLEKAKEIYVDVEQGNVNGIKFYKARGFQTIREFDDEIGGYKLKTVEMILNL
ncbi:GNAT family N-acetyltransferase [Alkalicoccus daliensis]|uniref:Ribosomal protein S18 acetylase RimI n=1 Tax=Alkalicoccus daliensis TaxID=745820 RepID=A0A1H0D6M1_9BACI|nr:GNAT family N-acetyltransferase [Alkalicoccus daliensis]SDN65739.1 Ribosomal protein S18 acetylase RimI [Alkalicoccus daliensis]